MRVLGWPVCLACGLRTPLINRSAVKLNIDGLSNSPGPLSAVGMVWRRWDLLGFLQIKCKGSVMNDHMMK